MRTLIALAGLALSTVALCAEVQAIDPPELGFYAKRIQYAGIAIKSHGSVDDRALVLARDKVARMLRSLPVVQANLAAAGAELHIIGRSACAKSTSMRINAGKSPSKSLTACWAAAWSPARWR